MDEETAVAAAAPPGKMVARIGARTDVSGCIGEWLGQPGSGLPIEAISVAAAATGSPGSAASIDCQLIYAKDLRTPWTAAGFPCGSLGLGIGCRGARFRLTADTAPFFACRYDIAFTDGTSRSDVPGGEIALALSGAPVEAIRLRVMPRLAVQTVSTVPDDPGRADGVHSPADDPAIRLRLLSPAFSTREPEIRNAAAIPGGPWRAMAGSFQRGAFSSRVVSLRVIRDAIVVGEGVVFDRTFNLVPGTNRLIGDDSVERFWIQAQEAKDRGIRRIAGTSVLCKTRAPDNYGHFLMEMFPKAWLVAQLMDTGGFTHIIHQTAIATVARNVLALAGIDPSVIASTDDRPVQCDSLIVVDGLTSHGSYQSPISVQALAELADRVPAASLRKIYVRRQARARNLLNQDAVESILVRRGFAVVDPAQMPLADQISLFKGADTVVGPLGAALTNVAFCPRGSRIVALTAQSFPDTFFWFLCQHRGHDYCEVRGLDASGTPEQPQSWLAGFAMREDDLAFLGTL